MTKGLLFTMTNRAAAVRLFWKEFPNTKPTSLDDASALKNSVHIMDRFLEMALQGQSTTATLGAFIPANWESTHADFVKVGALKGTEPATAAYTTKFIATCNDFDHAAIVARAKAAEE